MFNTQINLTLNNEDSNILQLHVLCESCFVTIQTICNSYVGDHVKIVTNENKCEVHEDVKCLTSEIIKKSTTSNNESWVHRTLILKNNIILELR